MDRPDQFFAAYQDAVARRDRAAMVALYEPGVRVFDAWEQFETTGMGPLVDAWFGGLGTESVEAGFAGVDLNVGSGVAWASAELQFRARDGAGLVLRQMRNRVSLGFVQTGNRWLVRHQHTSLAVSPQDTKALFL